jgi:pilus assembly protein Flp/PilA
MQSTSNPALQNEENASTRLQSRRDINLLFTRLLDEDSGQDLIEYVLVAALLALGAVVAMKGLSAKISTTYNSIGSSVTSAV